MQLCIVAILLLYRLAIHLQPRSIFVTPYEINQIIGATQLHT
jgi:hypothetical protein